MAYHRINHAALNVLLRSPTGGVARDMYRRGLKVESAAKRNLAGANGAPRRINHGHTRTSVNARPIVWRGMPASRIGSPLRRAKWIHDGTGVFGPYRTPIVPKTAKFLRFRPKGARRVIYVRSVKGMEPNPFLADALSAARD